MSACEQTGVNCYFWGRANPFMNGLELETWADLQSEMNRRVCRINTVSVMEHYRLFLRLSKRSLGTSSVCVLSCAERSDFAK